MQKLVLVRLADRADDDGRCWPGLSSLARECCASIPTVRAAIKALVDKGHLLIESAPTFNGSTRYRVTPKPPESPSPVEADSPPQEALPVKAACTEGVKAACTGSESSLHRIPINPQGNPQLPGLAPVEVVVPKRSRKADPIFDAVREACVPPGRLTKSEASLIGKVCREIRDAAPEVTADQIRAMAARYRSTWPKLKLTPGSMTKFWNTFAAESPADELARLEAELETHPGNPEFVGHRPESVTAEQTADYRSKRVRRKELRAKLEEGTR